MLQNETNSITLRSGKTIGTTKFNFIANFISYYFIDCFVSVVFRIYVDITRATDSFNMLSVIYFFLQKSVIKAESSNFSDAEIITISSHVSSHNDLKVGFLM